MTIALLILYLFFLTFVLLYSFSELTLIIRFILNNKRKIKSQREKIKNFEFKHYPFVTIQLPVYNEFYVVERLLESVASLDYPKDKFEIQLLDDSTDESFELATKKVEELKSRGFQVEQIKRPERTGFKAGALAYGLELAKGEFIAIFDADFLPKADFIKACLPFFENEKTGVVQTRWGHLNKNYSLLTRLQAIALDSHFVIEQVGRNQNGSFINFNGTAGIWRKACIIDAGGWSADTLTEDLDLSYRAQLKGWHFDYLVDQISPAELPADMNAVKSQQFRWSKGGAECARKNLVKLYRSSHPLATKLLGTFHLMNSFLFICIFFIGVLSIPLIWIMHKHSELNSVTYLFFIYYASIIILTLGYFISEIYLAKHKLLGFLECLLLYPLFLSVSMGLSIYNSIAVIEGYSGKKSPFIRTPKFNIKDKSGTWYKTKYAVRKLPLSSLLELLAAFVFAGATALAIYLQSYVMLVYFVMLSLGFVFVFFASLRHLSK